MIAVDRGALLRSNVRKFGPLEIMTSAFHRGLLRSGAPRSIHTRRPVFGIARSNFAKRSDAGQSLHFS